MHISLTKWCIVGYLSCIVGIVRWVYIKARNVKYIIFGLSHNPSCDVLSHIHQDNFTGSEAIVWLSQWVGSGSELTLMDMGKAYLTTNPYINVLVIVLGRPQVQCWVTYTFSKFNNFEYALEDHVILFKKKWSHSIWQYFDNLQLSKQHIGQCI